MQKHDTIIYEYDNIYFIIQRSKQDKRQEECPSENVALANTVFKSESLSILGKAVFESIENYGVVEPSYYPWEQKALRKQLCGWIGAKSYAGLLKNSRLVLVQKNFDEKRMEIIPYDNFNINKWETMLLDEMICLPVHSDFESIGLAIDKAFTIATYHPDKKV
ncbi:DUF1436 domain-containing protein [Salmonella enterica]|nr:DUF1436 domain-containing protein [Salmonella enterica subsp. enterica serovar Oranienburg]EDS7122541.1 DUF1436 domain-containing protein [Salmonella enterica subsp. enterica]EEH2569770.1 DUF1436 domain-containing protein [Salmonella enterica]EJW2021903.1 DUF1436 domain-containing protein [Salmonella enterica]EJW2026397.1 DUF1436 domain-containing protein [Salmonella enterica]